MKARIWGLCSECGETVECMKDSTGFKTLKHGECDAAGCQPDVVIENGKMIALTEEFDDGQSEDGETLAIG